VFSHLLDSWRQDPLTLEDIRRGQFSYRLPRASAYEVETENRSRLLKQIDKVITDAIPVVVASSAAGAMEPLEEPEGTCTQVTFAFGAAAAAE